MTIGTRIDSTLGPIATNNTAGISLERNSGNKGFHPFQVDSVQALTASVTLGAGDAGVTTMSSSAALTQSMPLASACPGAEFVFRNLSAHAHVLTGSQETAGTKVFISQVSGSSAGNGSKLTLGNTVGQSVMLKSDGLSFHVLSYSGSLTINGT